MRLRSITLTNVRRFTDPMRIEGIRDGVNVLCQPNEFGKSTLFDAVQAVFFKRHNATGKEIKALQPRAGGAPEVRVEVETGDGIFAVSKRWLSKPEVRVEQGGRLIAQADSAEDWIGRLIGGGDGGPAGLLWVRQGMTALSSGQSRPTKEDVKGQDARRDLMSSVGQEVEAMTGGRRMDAALERCREELRKLVTATNRPAAHGRLKAVLDRVETLEAEHADLSATARSLREALDTRRSHRRELAEIEAPDTIAARQQRLKDATAAHDAAARHAEEVTAARSRLSAATVELSRATERRLALAAALSEREEADTALSAAIAERDEAQTARETATTDMARAEDGTETARAHLEAARTGLRAAERHQDALAGAARRKELQDRIARAETERRRRETEAAAASQDPDEAALRRLEALQTRRTAALAAQEATATTLTLRCDPGAEGLISLDGVALEDGRTIAVPRRAQLRIEGVGTLDLRPPEDGRGKSELEKVTAELADALDSLGCEDMDAARDAAATRLEATQRLREADAVFRSLAPDGLDPLRAALAAIPELAEESDGEVPDRAVAEAAFETARAEQIEAQIAHNGAADRLSAARTRAATAEAAAQAAEGRLGRAQAALERFSETDADALAAAETRARDDLEAAHALHETRRRDAPDLEAARAALDRARSIDTEARETADRLRPEIARLDERIARGSGDAVDERLASTQQDLEVARATQAAIQHDVAVLRRLETALDSARADARDRYFQPVADELRPLLTFLWPDSQLTWEADTVLPTELVRDGTAEPIDVLSGGTQEQVALLVRLAFARMLAKAGRHAPVILDDAMVHTDDDRIERLFDALHRQAGDLQILVLSCRQRAFRELGGHVLRPVRPSETGGD